MTTRKKYINGLRVGVAQTFGGGVAVGGDGKWSPVVANACKRHGLSMHHLTGEWYSADGSKFPELLATLEQVAS